MKIIGLCGSLRKESYNLKLLKTVAAMLPSEVQFEIINIGTLPLYNQDLEATFPTEALALKEKITAADGIILATPEYNRTFSAPLSNAIEWSSRPYGDSAWEGKKVFVLGGSSGTISTALAQYDLKKVLLYLNTKMMGQPEVMINTVQDKFNPAGILVDQKTKEFLQKAITGFVNFVRTT